jgi:4-amino-4-deoxy-L-arabinose transferase-like glycosyltransferase
VTARLVLRRLRAGLFALACAAAAWGLWLTVVGGVNASLFGLVLRSNNPQRVFIFSVLLLGAYFLLGGRLNLAALLRHTEPLVRAGRTLTAALGRRPAVVAWTIAAASVVNATAGSTRIAGGSDVYGYVSQADLWLAGSLVQQQPWVSEVPWPEAEWTFTPLGYRPAYASSPGAIVPTYSPGLPLLLAAAKALGGQCAMFAVVPLCLGLGVLATYGIGSRLGSPWAGVIGAWLVATSPAVLVVSFEALTDVPVMTAWGGAFYLLLAAGAAPARGERLLAVSAGLLAGLAILIRPNLVLLTGPMALWFLVRRSPQSSGRLTPALLFALGALPGVLVVALINNALYGSPATSGYGSFHEQFALARMGTNLQRYLSWFAYAQTPLAFVGVLALAVPSRRIWPGLDDRRTLGAIAVFVLILWLQYSAYLEFDSWSYLRFLLPSWPFIMVGVGAMILAAVDLASASLSRTTRTVLAGAAAVALCGWTLAIASRSEVFGQRQAAEHEAPLGQLVRQHTRENSVVLAFERSGSLRYYAGRTTLRYDFLPGDWLDGAVEWLTRHGVHVYAVLDPAHLADVRRRFAGQRTLAALDRPVLLYEPNRTTLFDLSSPPPPERSLILVERDPGGRAACDPPAARRPLILR